MLALIPSHHVDRLLNQIEIEVLIRRGRSEIKISIYECLRTCVKKGVDIRLVPTGLLYGLKFAIKVIEPLTYVALVRL